MSQLGTLAASRARLDAGFASLGSLIVRRPWSTIGVMLMLAASLISQLPRIGFETSLEGFLKESDPMRVAYNDFRRQFGRDEIIMVALEPPEVFDLPFLERLRAFHEDLEASVPWLDEVTSLINARSTRGEADELIVEDLLETWPANEKDLATLRDRVLRNPFYRNLLISEDASITAVLIRPAAYTAEEPVEALADEFEADQPEPELRFLTGEENSEIVRSVQQVIGRHEGPEFPVHLAGSPVLSTEIQNSMRRDLVRFVGLAIGSIALFLLAIFRRVSAVVLPVTVVVLAVASTAGAMALVGVPISHGTQILPSFLLAVGVGYAVHLLTIFFQQMREGEGRHAAIVFALEHSGLAIAMTALTTAAGLGSFAAADLQPIAMLGAFAPVGVLLCLLFGVVLLPALLAVIPIRAEPARRDPPRPDLAERLLVKAGGFAAAHAGAVVATTIGILVVSLTGVAQVRFSHDPLAWFSEDNPVRVAIETVDQRLNGSFPLELVISTGSENGLHDPATLDKLEEVAHFAETANHWPVSVGKAISLNGILKEIHQALNENQVEYYAIPRERQLIAQELLLFENSGSDDLEEVVDSQFSSVRMTLKVGWTDSLHFPAFINEMESFARKTLGPDVEVVATGLLSIMSRTFSAVIYSMAKTYIVALAIITPLMIFLIGTLRAGFVSMVPNLTPLILALGFMGWTGIPLDIFTLLIGSIALGLAVDDTIHFIHCFQKYYAKTGDPQESVRQTLRTTGRALLFTSLVLSTGFYIFTLSEMNNLYYFGLLTSLAIVTAFVADILISPALLVLVIPQQSARVTAREAAGQ